MKELLKKEREELLQKKKADKAKKAEERTRKAEEKAKTSSVNRKISEVEPQVTPVSSPGTAEPFLTETASMDSTPTTSMEFIWVVDNRYPWSIIGR